MNDNNTKPKPGSPEWAEVMQKLSLERKATKEAAMVVYLPTWPEARRGSPNEIVRSALFNVRNRHTPRRYFKDEPIVIFGDGEIAYTGIELRQDDLDVWLQLLHLTRQQPLGEWVEFTAYAMVKALGWSIGGASYRRLQMCLTQLQATAVRVQSKRLGKLVIVSLVKECRRSEDDNSGRWQVQVSKDMCQLFAAPFYTLVEWDQRKGLGPLAKWLHGFYASHAEPYPLKVATLQGACGATAAPREFRRMLKVALDELKAVGFLKGWQVEKGLVYVDRA